MQTETNARYITLWAVAGFLVVVAFGVGIVAEAAFFSGRRTVAATAASSEPAARVTLGDLFVKPEAIELPDGTETLEVVNTGKVPHNFAVPGVVSSEMLEPGESSLVNLEGLKPGTYEFICEVPGHAQAGMKGTITVGAGGSGEATGKHRHMSPQEMAAADAERTGAFPAQTRGRGARPLKPRIASDGTRVFELTADEVRWEVEPGVFKQAMAYNGMVPGPTIRARLGDRVRIVLHNRLSQPTTLHFHGLVVPNDQDGVPVINQDPVMPGDSHTYEFTVRNTGSHMYHSHFMADQQVPAGLLGPFIVEDRRDPEVDVDQVMVLNDGALGYTLNGKSFPATEPIAVRRGGLVRIRYINEGSMIHPMHLHGMPQEVIAIDGNLLDDPYLADTVPVAPGQRIDVLVRASEPGTWAFHCHILSHAESSEGMFGMVTAMVVR